LSFDQDGDTILGTWFTYDLDGAPLWLSMTARKTGARTYSGDLYRRAGARFDAFDPAAVRSTRVGAATLEFSDTDSATFAFAIDGVGPVTVHRTKAITRAMPASQLIPCQWPAAIGLRSSVAEEPTSPSPTR
jgi:hypothetical protein